MNVVTKKIKKSEIIHLLSDWQRKYIVYAPSRTPDGSSRMAEWDGGDGSFLDWYRNTTVPGKNIFLPPVEVMFRFRKSANSFTLDVTPAAERKTLIFGIRPCDARALRLLDSVFESDSPDPYYVPRRSNTLLVGIGCNNPYETCFCTSLHGGPFDASHVDLLLTDAGGEFYIEAVTDASADLLARSEYVNEADEVLIREIKESAGKKITRRLDAATIREQLSANFENKAYWEKIAARCVSCGVCTLLCPTCHCFDICDENIKGDGRRFRHPDSCSFAGYTRMPAENPRDEKWKRLRNRVCHKYLFYPMNFGDAACTGCGRCTRLCPVKWDIVNVLTELAAE